MAVSLPFISDLKKVGCIQCSRCPDFTNVRPQISHSALKFVSLLSVRWDQVFFLTKSSSFISPFPAAISSLNNPGRWWHWARRPREDMVNKHIYPHLVTATRSGWSDIQEPPLSGWYWPVSTFIHIVSCEVLLTIQRVPWVNQKIKHTAKSLPLFGPFHNFSSFLQTSMSSTRMNTQHTHTEVGLPTGT